MILHLLFRLQDDTYAVEATRVVRVLPFAALKALPQAPPGIVGLLDYRGEPIPVADFSLCATGVACRPRWTTRIMLVRLSSSSGERLLGIVAEGLCRAERLDPTRFTTTGVDSGESRFLGPVLDRDGELIQRVELNELLSPELMGRLFPLEAGLA